MPNQFAEALSAISRALDDSGFRYYLFGAQAALLHGSARLTADIDITVDLGGHPTDVILDTLQQAGFSPRFSDPDFIIRTQVIPFVHDQTSIPVDVVLAGSGLESMILARATRRNIAGVEFPVASAEDIVVLKVLAGRPKDTDDIQAIVAAQGDQLDHAYVRHLLRELEEALGVSDLLRLFEHLASETH